MLKIKTLHKFHDPPWVTINVEKNSQSLVLIHKGLAFCVLLLTKNRKRSWNFYPITSFMSHKLSQQK